MPARSKRQRAGEKNTKKARAKKGRIEVGEGSSAGLEESGEVHGLLELATMSGDALDTEDEAVDPSFDLDSSMKDDVDHMIEAFCEEWVLQLDRDDALALGLFLSFQLSKHFNMGATKAAELAGLMIGRSDRTVREWRTYFFNHEGQIPDCKQGQYQRTGVLWCSEDLNKKAKKYVRNNCNVKGKPNLTVGSFCEWINNDLLPNSTLEPGFPRKVSPETARKWLHELGFSVLDKKKGTFVDGHERDDVVEYRSKFLRKLIGLGFLNEGNAPTEDAKTALRNYTNLEQPSPDIIDKTIVIFHDESTFHANEYQATFWGEKGTTVMRPKSRGSGIMVSDFIEENNGYLALTQAEYDEAKKSDSSAKMYARQLLEFGENKEGYWTSDKFISQIRSAVKIANIKYPKSSGYKIVWMFDHSSCHAAMADDSLDVNHMNVNPGGKQRVMRDGWWGGKPQKMTDAHGVPKGLKRVLEERGINTARLNQAQMRELLGSHPDFKYEKSRIERLLTEEYGHIVYMIPKFHCELNPIERVWAQAKRYARAYCKYNIQSLRNTVIPALDVVTLDNIKNHFRKVRHYMFAYLEGIPGGSDLEKLVKAYKKEIKSHRRISEIQ